MEKEKIKENIKKLNCNNIDIKDKISIAKELLTTTDIPKTFNVLYLFDNKERDNDEINYLEIFLDYKESAHPYYKGVDCDVSIICVVMYSLLNDNFDTNNIINQSGSQRKYEIVQDNQRFRGDTLTSALHLLKLYLGCLWSMIDKKIKNNEFDISLLSMSQESVIDEKIKNNELLKKYEDDYKKLNFYNLFKKVSSHGIPEVPEDAPEDDWNSYCREHCDIIWNAMDEFAKNFLKNYNMLGNYMCIPGNSHQNGNGWISFNVARSNRGKWDTVDTLLVKLYRYYYDANKCSDDSYLQAIFTCNNENLVKETKDWLKMFKTWEDFVEKNALQAFVDKKLIPISLKTGKAVKDIDKIEELKKYDAIPENYDQFVKFFEELYKRIESRSECIYKKLSSN